MSNTMLDSERKTSNRRRMAKLFVWNALVGAVIFLPVFLVVVPIEGLVRGANLSGGFNPHFGYALFLYVAEVIPVIIGSLVNTVALIMIPSTWSKAQKRVTAICLSPLLPSTLLLIGGLSGSDILLERIVATAVATISYGVFCRVSERG